MMRDDDNPDNGIFKDEKPTDQSLGLQDLW